MIYQLISHGWPLNGGAAFLEAGTQVDTDASEWQWLADVVPPPNAQCLDQAAYDVMAQHYPYNIILDDGTIDRHRDPA
jgi:hypothetical protein